MKFNFHVSPSIKCKLSTQSIMRDLTIGLLIVYACSIVYYGMYYGTAYAMQAILLMVVSLAAMLLCEGIFAKAMKKDIKTHILNSFGWVTSIILVLMCPISITPYAVFIATIFALVFGKLLFGGFGQNIFNPAAMGRAVIMAAFVGKSTSLVTAATPTAQIASQLNWLPANQSVLESFLSTYGGFTSLAIGTYPGALGETFALVIIAVGVFLVIRQVIDWRVPVVYLGTIFVMTAIIACISGLGSFYGIPALLWYPCLHLLTGGVVFGAVFMLTDPVTSPTSAAGRVIFAMGAAILTVMIRLNGNLPEGCLYSILLMNMLTPMIESFLDGKQLEIKAKAMKCAACLAIIALGICFFSASSNTPVTGEETASIQTVEQEAI